MKTMVKVLFIALILAPALVMGQGQVILLDGQRLDVDVKKITGSVVTVLQDGLEKDINLVFVHKIISNQGKEVATAGYYSKDYVNPKDMDGHTQQIDHTPVLEQEADNLFSGANKIVIDRPAEGKGLMYSSISERRARIESQFNAFLSLLSEKSIVLYINKAKEFSAGVGNTYKLGDIVSIKGLATTELEYRWTAQFVTESQVRFIMKNNEENKMTYRFSEGQLIFMHPKSKSPLVFTIVYLDENSIRYYSNDRDIITVKTLSRVGTQTAAATK